MVFDFGATRISIAHINHARRHVRGEGVAEMSTFLNNGYIVKVSTKGGGVKNTPNSVYVVCTRPLAEKIPKY